VTGPQAARAAGRARPGATVRRVRRFRGAATRRVFEVTLAEGESVEPVVVRDHGDDAESAAFEAAVLGRLAGGAVAVPRVLLVDGGTLVISRLPGRPEFAPRDPAAWAEGLAATLAAIHRLPTEPFRDLVPDHDRDLAEHIGAGPSEALLGHPDGAPLWSELTRRYPALRPVEPRLLHGDYFAGNVLWSRRRVAGVVDWEACGLGAAGSDVGNCRAELAMHHGPKAADLFLRSYEALAGPVPDLRFWDLLGAQWLLPDPERYLGELRAFGARDLSREVVQDGLRGFVAAAL
jgi:aminoglycoside phosphotransferase (APT) family kinase protein